MVNQERVFWVGGRGRMGGAILGAVEKGGGPVSAFNTGNRGEFAGGGFVWRGWILGPAFEILFRWFPGVVVAPQRTAKARWPKGGGFDSAPIFCVASEAWFGPGFVEGLGQKFRARRIPVGFGRAGGIRTR